MTSAQWNDAACILQLDRWTVYGFDFFNLASCCAPGFDISSSSWQKWRFHTYVYVSVRWMVLWQCKNCLVVHSTNSIIVCALAAFLAFLCASWASVRQMERHQRLTRPQMRELTSTLGKESPAKSFLLQQLYVFYDKGSRCVFLSSLSHEIVKRLQRQQRHGFALS